MVLWCKEEAEKKNLKECDYWGGLDIDEMKVEVNKPFSFSGSVRLLCRSTLLWERIYREGNRWT